MLLIIIKEYALLSFQLKIFQQALSTYKTHIIFTDHSKRFLSFIHDKRVIRVSGL